MNKIKTNGQLVSPNPRVQRGDRGREMTDIYDYQGTGRLTYNSYPLVPTRTPPGQYNNLISTQKRIQDCLG